MRSQRTSQWPTSRAVFAALTVCAGLFLAVGRAGAQSDVPPALPSEETPEVLTSGPINEAFAAPVNFEPQSGVVAPMAPPEAISETPSAEKPAGDNYVWVPGYWGWDSDNSRYIWISACWRQAPPGKAWVPGYWAHVTAGYEWVPGYWSDAGVQDVDYLPTPPAPLDLEAPSAPPSLDVSWVPGCWYWDQTRYVERRGYWLHQQPGWSWTPSHYVWTPRGYVFVRGHWDYPFERRGVLFAPVAFRPAAYSRPLWFSPSITLDLGSVVANLFIRPSYSHYYAGDYYDAGYQRTGIYPRFNAETAHTWYDPTYVYDRWQHRNDGGDWRRNQQTTFAQLQVNVNLRPARTWQEQQSRIDRAPAGQRPNTVMAVPLSTAVNHNAQRMPFERVTPQRQQVITQQANAVRTYRDDRSHWETLAPTERTRPAAVTPTRPLTPLPGRPTTPIPDRPTTTLPGRVTTPAAPGGLRQPYVPPADVTRSDAERVHVAPPPLAARTTVAPPTPPAAAARPAPAASGDRDRDRTPGHGRTPDR